jgi:hypothetical protein
MLKGFVEINREVQWASNRDVQRSSYPAAGSICSENGRAPFSSLLSLQDGSAAQTHSGAFSTTCELHLHLHLVYRQSPAMTHGKIDRGTELEFQNKKKAKA